MWEVEGVKDCPNDHWTRYSKSIHERGGCQKYPRDLWMAPSMCMNESRKMQAHETYGYKNAKISAFYIFAKDLGPRFKNLDFDDSIIIKWKGFTFLLRLVFALKFVNVL